MLAEGEEVRYASGMNLYTKREQFNARRKTASQRKVRGITFATMDELRREGMIVPVHQRPSLPTIASRPLPDVNEAVGLNKLNDGTSPRS